MGKDGMGGRHEMGMGIWGQYPLPWATVTSFNAPPEHERKQVFYAKELPVKHDADGNERTPRDRFMYNTHVNVQYHNAHNVQSGRFYALNLLERSHAKSDEWELWREMA